MPRIRSLKANVTRDEAVAIFSSGSALNALRNIFPGPLRSVAELYIPFRVFRVEITNRGVTQLEHFGLEVVSGVLDLFRFDDLPETIVVETRNRIEPQLEDSRAEDLLVGKIRRLLYSKGFFKMKDLRLVPAALPGEVYVPYWMGFRGRSGKASFAVLDAVRRRPEGGRVRQLAMNWLLSSGSERVSSP